MPDFCYNKMKVLGTPSQLAEFRARFLYQTPDDDFTLNSIVSSPYAPNNGPGIMRAELEWRSENWDTTSDALDV